MCNAVAPHARQPLAGVPEGAEGAGAAADPSAALMAPDTPQWEEDYKDPNFPAMTGSVRSMMRKSSRIERRLMYSRSSASFRRTSSSDVS